MIKAKKQNLFAVLEKEIKRAKTIAEEKRETAKEFRIASRSQQGELLMINIPNTMNRLGIRLVK